MPFKPCPGWKFQSCFIFLVCDDDPNWRAYFGMVWKPLTTIPSTYIYIYITEGSLEVKLPTIWTDGKKQRWEESEGRREEETRSEKRKSEKKEDAGARKGRKVAKHCVVPMFWGSGGSKSRLPKAAGAEPSGQMRDEKLHAVVARSTFRSQHVQSTSCSEHFWKLRCRKSARWCGAKHMSKSSQNHKNTPYSEHFWKLRCRKSVRGCGISKSKCYKHHMFGPLLDRFVWPCARDSAPCQKWERCKGFVAFPKTMAGVDIWSGSVKTHFGVSGAIQETCSCEMFGGHGEDFLRWVCILERQIFRFGKMIMCDRCSTSYDLASLFRGRRNTLDTWIGLIAKRIGMRPSALHSTFNFWRKSRRIALFFDVINFESWGCLAELLSFLKLSSSKSEDVSPNCCVFDVAKFKNWGIAELLRFSSLQKGQIDR